MFWALATHLNVDKQDKKENKTKDSENQWQLQHTLKKWPINDANEKLSSLVRKTINKTMKAINRYLWGSWSREVSIYQIKQGKQTFAQGKLLNLPKFRPFRGIVRAGTDLINPFAAKVMIAANI